MTRKIMAALAASSFLALSAPATAAITWADLTSQDFGAGTVNGTVMGVGVTYSGGYSFAQTSGGIDYWNGSYINSWSMSPPPPPTSDIIALGNGGRKTITFSQSVTDVYLALNSWNVPGTVTFDHDFTSVVIGCGYWGCGSLFNQTANSFESYQYGNEIHGILKFAGPITSLTFTDPTEHWHGIQIGIGGLAGAVPEPSTWALMLLGFGAVGYAMRRRTVSYATA